jgi:hypothetical protein
MFFYTINEMNFVFEFETHTKKHLKKSCMFFKSAKIRAIEKNKQFTMPRLTSNCVGKALMFLF